VTVRNCYFLAAAAGLWMALPLPGQEPARLEVERGQAITPRVEISTEQTLANAIADHLRQSGQLHHYRIDINVSRGAAELSGSVVDQPQREEALRLVQGVPGVERVRDRLILSGQLEQVQGQATAEQGPPPRRIPGPGMGGGEPVPIYQAPAPGPHDLNPPKMPPYAWPTYAPYNNYSRVAYPEAYPYQAWPFIGPVYPFPKVPLGWRSIKLEWEDGHWWYSRVATGNSYWRLRFW
jgi:hypothetical protein